MKTPARRHLDSNAASGPTRARDPGTGPRAARAHPESRRLRVAVIQNGTIVEERLLPARTDASLGNTPGATFIVAWAPDARSRRHVLFAARGGRYSLHLLPGMHARLAVDDRLVDYRTDGDTAGDRVVLLPENARGRVVAGDVTLLFQFVRPPPPRPRAKLPSSMRGSLWDRIDPWFAAVAIASLLLHLGLTIYLRGLDWPRKPDIETLADRFVHDSIARPIPKPPDPERAIDARRPVAKIPVVKTPAAAKAPTAPTPPAPSAAERRATIATEVNKRGLLAVLHSLSTDGKSLPDLLSHGGVDVDQERALAQVGSVAVATADNRLRGVGDTGGHGRVVSVSSLHDATTIAAAVVGPDVRERRISAHVAPETPVIESGNADPGAIAGEVKRRLAAVRACYERALRRTPTLAGKIVLRFTVAPAGNVASVSIDDDTMGSPEVAACVRETVARWRFAAGPESIEVAFPFVFQSSG